MEPKKKRQNIESHKEKEPPTNEGQEVTIGKHIDKQPQKQKETILHNKHLHHEEYHKIVPFFDYDRLFDPTDTKYYNTVFGDISTKTLNSLTVAKDNRLTRDEIIVMTIVELMGYKNSNDFSKQFKTLCRYNIYRKEVLNIPLSCSFYDRKYSKTLNNEVVLKNGMIQRKLFSNQVREKPIQLTGYH